MNVTIYVEGGGDGRQLKAKCRKGFGAFFRKAGLSGRMPTVFVGGSRSKTYRSFCRDLAKATPETFIVLLVDSEGPVAAGAGPWQHLKKSDGWNQPPKATDDNAHLMVQCMEAWFLADKEYLSNFFGQGFNSNSLPDQPNIEKISKNDVLDGMKNATRQCKTKDRYDKGRHSFDILSQVDPNKVIHVSSHARRLLDTLAARADERKTRPDRGRGR